MTAIGHRHRGLCTGSGRAVEHGVEARQEPPPANSSRGWHLTCERSRPESTTMILNVTLLDLVNAVAEHARSEAEILATVVFMVNRGHVQLCGTFKGTRFGTRSDLDALAAA